MINVKVWESFNGTQTPIAEMDTRHCINAIQVIERNDPRYGVKHGAALPALLAEVEGRARRTEGSWGYDKEARDFVLSRKPAATRESPRVMSDFHVGDMVHERMSRAMRDTIDAGVYARFCSPRFVFAVDPATPPKTVEHAHKRLDKQGDSIRDIHVKLGRVEADLCANEKHDRDNALDLTTRTEQIWSAINDAVERLADAEARITAIETPPARKRTTKAKRK